MAIQVAKLQTVIQAKDEASSVLDKVGSKLGGLGPAGMAAGAAGAAGIGLLVAGAAQGVKAAGDLQQSVTNISTIKPEIDTSAVFSALNEMSTKIPQSAEELGDSLYDVFSSMDVGQEQALKLVETFAKGAVGAQTDAKTFGTSIMGVMNAYSMSVEDAAHVSDVFFNTVNSGVVTGQELASSLGPVTQAAKSAGVGIDELGALIAGVTKEGGPAAQNINNLNNTLSKITTKDAQENMKKLGVSVTDQEGNFRPMIDVLGDLRDKTAGMTAEARNAAIQKIFPDAQARQGAMTIMSQIDNVREYLEVNKNATGAASSAYEKMSATFNSQTKLLGNTFQSILTTVGAKILPAITPLITAFAEKLPAAFKALEEVAGPILETVTGAISGLFDKGGIASGIRGFLDQVKTAVSEIVQGFKTGGLAGGGINILTHVFGMDEDAAGDIIDNLEAAFARVQNTVSEIVKGFQTGGFAGGTINILTHVFGMDEDAAGDMIDQFQNIADQARVFVQEQLIPTLRQVGRFIMTDFLPAMAQIGDFIFTKLIPAYLKIRATILESLLPILSQLAEFVLQRIVPAIAEFVVAFQRWTTEIAPLVGPALQGIQRIVETVMGAISAFWSEHWNTIKTVLEVVWTIIRGTVERAMISVSGIIKAVMQVLDGDWSGAWTTIKETAGRIWESLRGDIERVAGLIGAMLGVWLGERVRDFRMKWEEIKMKVAGTWSDMYRNIEDKMSEIGTAISIWLAHRVQDFREKWEEIKAKIAGAWSDIYRNIEDKMGEIGTAMSTWIGDRIRDFTTFGTDLQDTLAKPWNWLKDNVGGIMKSAMNAALEPLRLAMRGFEAFVNAIKGAINWLSNKVGLGDLVAEAWTAPQIPMLAKGSKDFQGGPAIVGEKGPELVYLPKHATVIPNRESMAMLQAAGIPGFQGGLNWPLGTALGDLIHTDLGTYRGIQSRANVYNSYGPNDHPTYADVGAFHTGLDIAVNAVQTAINAAASGVVRRAVANESSVLGTPGGGTVVLGHGSYDTVYAHLGRVNVNPGDRVSRGQKIGSGSPRDVRHLHFETRQPGSGQGAMPGHYNPNGSLGLYFDRMVNTWRGPGDRWGTYIDWLKSEADKFASSGILPAIFKSNQWGDITAYKNLGLPTTLEEVAARVKETVGRAVNAGKETLTGILPDWDPIGLVQQAMDALGIGAPNLPGVLADMGPALLSKGRDIVLAAAKASVNKVMEQFKETGGDFTGGGDYAFPVAGYRGGVSLHWGSHPGAADLFGPIGTAILAMRGGHVNQAGWGGLGGNTAMIRGSDGLLYYYAHLLNVAVRAGQNVNTGQRIGSLGETGNAAGTGAHLHIGIGPEIMSGTGPGGGAGRNFDAVGLLRRTLRGGSQPAERPYADGGWITEPVMGVGTRSGASYSFGERGPEFVSPGGGSQKIDRLIRLIEQQNQLLENPRRRVVNIGVDNFDRQTDARVNLANRRAVDAANTRARGV